MTGEEEADKIREFLRMLQNVEEIREQAREALQRHEEARPGVRFIPTTEAAVEAMLKLADVKRSDTVYDLGCGDGRIAIAAAKQFGAHAVGIDIDAARIQEAEENARKAGVQALVRFEEKDLYEADIHEATLVTLFLLPEMNVRLRPKLLQDLRPGTRVVSNTFNMGDWKADKEAMVGGSEENYFLSRKLYLWVVPERNAK